jgi:BirA family biotin operon repressor/biotin-[acetyl-CoA-carboxylase] ligase
LKLGTPRLHLREVDSTNVRAQRLAVSGAPHGTLVTAETQTAGHGRQGRTWVTPAGRALACSLVLRDPPRLLPMLAALAVADVADRFDAAGRSAAIKWPNDVLLDGRKVAGILAEASERVVLGIGVNVGSAPWPGAGFVERDRVELLVEILERLERGYEKWLKNLY